MGCQLFLYHINLRFENLVNYDKSKTYITSSDWGTKFENLVNYDKSKTFTPIGTSKIEFENLVNYDKSKTIYNLIRNEV